MAKGAFYPKKDFVEDFLGVQTNRKPSRRDQEEAAVQYDLYAAGYRGDRLEDMTVCLCEVSAKLIHPTESIHDIMDRFDALKKEHYNSDKGGSNES